MRRRINANHMKPYQVPISVKGIVFDGDQVWLRKNERDEWELPGGKMDEGKQPAETVVRELREELGFQVKVVKAVHAWLYTIRKSADESRGVRVLSYLCRLTSRDGQFEINGEAGKAEFKKFSLAEIAALNIPDFYKEAIKLGWQENGNS